MKQYIGTKIIEAEPAYRCMDGQGRVTITDDPSEAFPNFPSVEDGYRVRYADGYVSWSPKDTFELVEASSCVSPENYDEKLGREICMKKIKDRVWHLLGFLLQTAVNGVK